MEHFYEDIDGWFGQYDEAMCRHFVDMFDSGSHFVEIGSYKGRSACCMSVEIINSNKDIKFDCVDTWGGSREHSGVSEVRNGTLLETFLHNVEPIKHKINNIHKMTSVEASKLYENNSLDFVFIDASHEYEDVLNDIIHWTPKVKIGGIISGHDVGWQGVQRAIHEYFEIAAGVDVTKHPEGSDWWFVVADFDIAG